MEENQIEGVEEQVETEQDAGVEGVEEQSADDVMVGDDEEVVDTEVKAPRVRRTFYGHHDLPNDMSATAATSFFRDQAIAALFVDGGASRIHLRGRRKTERGADGKTSGGDYLIASVTKAEDDKVSIMWSAGATGSPLTAEKKTEKLTKAQAAKALGVIGLIAHATSDRIAYGGSKTRVYCVLHMPKQRVEAEVEANDESNDESSEG